MINPEVAVPLFIVLATPVALVVRWFQHRERMARIAAESAQAPETAARLARLEQAIEAIAVETERIGEGQRYLTRVLGERPTSAPASRELRRADTPH